MIIFCLIFPLLMLALSEIDMKRAGLWVGLAVLSLPIEFLALYVRYGNV